MEGDYEALQARYHELVKVNEKLEKENVKLRENLKAYQKSLDSCEAAQQANQVMRQSPVPARSRKSFRRSLKKVKKKDIEGPNPDSLVHVSGARMESGKMVILDNSGLLDPRIRRFLALEGINENVAADPKKLKVIEDFAKENDLLKLLDKMKNNSVIKRLSKRVGRQAKPASTLSTETKSTPAKSPPAPPPAPPPPPPPPIPPAAVGESQDSMSSNDISRPVRSTEDLTSLIRARASTLRPAAETQLLRGDSPGSVKETDELLSALRRALDKISSAVRNTSDEDEDENPF